MKIPEQIIRLSIIVIVLLAIFIPVRSMLVPEDFGEIGHYRKSAIYDNIEKVNNYGGQALCVECHDDIQETKSEGYHRTLSCEACHGPSAKHADAPDEFIPDAPRERDRCPACHEYLPARPTGFPQIISASHNPKQPCINCHDAHTPVPPHVPEDCSACHAEISNTLTVSHHSYINCTKCHETPDEHFISPRNNLPSKPMTREFCGECHSEDSETNIKTRLIDLDSHNPRYKCWQCHYPHLPEAGK